MENSCSKFALRKAVNSEHVTLKRISQQNVNVCVSQSIYSFLCACVTQLKVLRIAVK